MLSHFNCVRLCVTPSTVTRQAPLSMGILQARILECVAMLFSRGSSHPGIEPRSPTLQVDSLPAELQGKPKDNDQVHFIIIESSIGQLPLINFLLPWVFILEKCIHYRLKFNTKIGRWGENILIIPTGGLQRWLLSLPTQSKNQVRERRGKRSVSQALCYVFSV